jgi:hypothetical protein
MRFLFSFPTCDIHHFYSPTISTTFIYWIGFDMRIEQMLWTAETGWQIRGNSDAVFHPQLVLFFCASRLSGVDERIAELKSRYVGADIIGCTTAGEISGEEVLDESVSATAIELSEATIRVESCSMSTMSNSFQAGQTLGSKFDKNGLRLVMIISDGHVVNGTELVNGLVDVLGSNIPVTGGLAGDKAHFEATMVSVNSPLTHGLIGAIGFYGEHLHIGHGSVGGWKAFGQTRRITKSAANVLYEIDGKPALQLYKVLLGERAKDLPGASLLFPLAVSPEDNSREQIVRTVLSINEEDGSMVFAGNMPEGYTCQLMIANFDQLVDGASKAADEAMQISEIGAAQHRSLGVLVSCVGRKLVLGRRTSDEVMAVRNILGPKAALTGFYSYGEIAPHGRMLNCELHNQTMTVTTITEEV